MATDYSKHDYLNRRLSALKLERETFIQHYKELSENVLPRKGRFFIQDRNKGDRRYQKIINSKATRAHRIARAGLLAGAMSPARPWFALETPDPDLMEFLPVKVWLYKVELLLRTIFNASNLYKMVPSMLGEFLLFGTGAMLHVDDFDDVARFYTSTVGSYLIGQDHKQKVNTLVREYEMTVEQLVAEFQYKNVSKIVQGHYDRGNYDAWYPVVHFIEPNPLEKPSSGIKKQSSKYKAFRSCYYEQGLADADKDKYLRESGFDEFPAYVPRWDVTGEDIYGTDCPGMTALGDIKHLQIEEKRKAQAIDKMVNPPMKGPASLRNVPVNALAGGLNIYDQAPQTEGLVPLYQVKPDLQHLTLDIQSVERRVDDAFHVDMFLAISNMEGIQPRNQFELQERNQERLLQLGPVLEQLHGEFLDALIDRTFKQCLRANILPEPPRELQGQPLRVKYISTLAMAQRAVATGGIDRLAAFAGGLVGAGFTGALDKFDADQAMDEYANVIGTPPRLIVPDEIVAQKRAAAQKVQQQAQQMQMANMAAQTGKAMADSKTGGEENMLTDARQAMRERAGS
jgi:hypothetical protein